MARSAITRSTALAKVGTVSGGVRGAVPSAAARRFSSVSSRALARVLAEYGPEPPLNHWPLIRSFWDNALPTSANSVIADGTHSLVAPSLVVVEVRPVVLVLAPQDTVAADLAHGVQPAEILVVLWAQWSLGILASGTAVATALVLSLAGAGFGFSLQSGHSGRSFFYYMVRNY